MGKFFGTDGIRGVAGSELTPELCIKTARATAQVLAKQRHHRPLILIAKDTRISGDMIESALCAGFTCVGADVLLAGVVPTPAVAYLVGKYNCDAGVVISASHNTMEFNGIKIFNGDGYKLPDETENEIEKLIEAESDAQEAVIGANIGRVKRADNAASDYAQHITDVSWTDLSSMKVAFDCANGAASVTAPLIFKKLGVQAQFIGCEPNGTNINDGCGSTHIEKLAEYVRTNGCDCGMAFDGDADRCLAVDENGDVIDGDKILAILSTNMKKAGRLNNNTVVATVMSNLGFMKYLQKSGIDVATTTVGDRYVLRQMREKGFNLGGEQSGHVILSDYATTGDGELTAVCLLNYFAMEKQTKVSTFNACYKQFPQVLINVKTTQEGKAKYKEDEIIEGFIEAKQQRMMGNGRVLVRPSGTEPLIRVMVEGEDLDRIDTVAKEIAHKIDERVN